MAQKKFTPVFSGLLHSPFSLAAGVVLVCAVRWIFIANGFDYGWDFETGYRVFLGGVYGRDFYTAVGPFSYQLIGTVFKILGPRWVWVYVIYYICWLTSILGSYFILKKISERREDLAFALMIVAPLSIPHLSALHVYNCLSYALAVWCGVCCFSYLEEGKHRSLMMAGFFAALSLFTKQNIGLGAALLTLFVVIASPILNRTKIGIKTLLALSSFLGAFGVFSFLLFDRFSREIGYSELWKLMFSDAAQAKGNFLLMLKTALPRISFGFSEEHGRTWIIQHLAEVFSYCLIIGLNYLWYRKLFEHKNLEKPNAKHILNLKDLQICFGVFLVLIIVPILFSDFVFRVRESFFWFDEETRFSRVVTVFAFWLMMFNFICCFFVLYKRDGQFFRKRSVQLLLFVFVLGLSVMACSSKFLYFFLNAPLLFGLFFVSVLNIHLWKRNPLIFVFGALNFAIYFYYPTHSLGPLIREEGPYVGGLLFSKTDSDFIESYTKKLRPLVQGKRTLWLVHGGPHSLSGSIPVRNVSNLYFDQYNIRIEESLVKDWMAHPPEMIVQDWFVTPDTSVWLRGEIFKSWIRDNYFEVAEISGKKVLQYRF